MTTTFPKLENPIIRDHLVAPATLDAAAGRAAIDKAIAAGPFRPYDVDRAGAIDPPALLYVPFWRVDVSVDGFHIGISTITNNSGRTISLPTGGARHKDGVVMICARTIVPYEAKLPSFFGRISGVPPLAVGLDELSSPDNAREALAQGEIVDAEIDFPRAQQIASGMVVRAVNPSSALYSKYEPQIRATHMCLYPLYYARYRYEGEARTHAGEQFFVMVSGRNGEIISAKHPSAVRSALGNVRRLLSFDRR